MERVWYRRGSHRMKIPYFNNNADFSTSTNNRLGFVVGVKCNKTLFYEKPLTGKDNHDIKNKLILKSNCCHVLSPFGVWLQYEMLLDMITVH